MYYDVWCLAEDGPYDKVPVLMWRGIATCLEDDPDVVFTRTAGCSAGPAAITVHFETSP